MRSYGRLEPPWPCGVFFPYDSSQRYSNIQPRGSKEDMMNGFLFVIEGTKVPIENRSFLVSLLGHAVTLLQQN